MKKKVFLHISMLTLLLVLGSALLLVGCGKRKNTSDTNEQAENVQNDGIQGTQDSAPEVEWESGAQEEQGSNQDTQGNPNTEKEKDTHKTSSSEKEEDTHKTPSSEKEEDTQDFDESVTTPQPNTEKGWGPVY